MNAVLREIEEEDRLWRSKARKRVPKNANKEVREVGTEPAQEPAVISSDDADASNTTPPIETESNQTRANQAPRPGFY